MKTQAAILVKQKHDLEIDEVEIPSLSFGQVLVQVHSTRICGSQIGEIDGVKGPDRWLPHLLGHEGGGVVLEVGPEVTTVKPGDRVVLHWRPGTGIDARPAQYKKGSTVVNAGNITTFNQYTVVSENRVTKVPDDCSFDLCCLLADTITTGFGVVNNNAQVKLGESIVIIGCGGISLGIVLGAALAGANPIIAVDIHDHKLEKAKHYGATHTINSKTENFVEKVKAIIGPQGADIVTDGTGNAQVIADAYALTNSKGRCILVGVMHHEKQLSINTLPLHFDKRLIGSEGGSSMPARDIPRYLSLIHQKSLDLSQFITHRTSLQNINNTINSMRSGEVIHAVVDF